MELVVDMWEDLQFTYHFEGLLVFCAGKTNTLADIASRIDRARVEQAMTDEIRRQNLGELQLIRDDVNSLPTGENAQQHRRHCPSKRRGRQQVRRM